MLAQAERRLARNQGLDAAYPLVGQTHPCQLHVILKGT